MQEATEKCGWGRIGAGCHGDRVGVQASDTATEARSLATTAGRCKGAYPTREERGEGLR